MKLPCAVVQDLLPLYAEELTNDVSKRLVEEHLPECPHCQKVLEELADDRPMTALTDAIPLHLVRQVLRRHTLAWCVLVGGLVAVLALVLMGRMTAAENTPYIKDAFSVETADDGLLSVIITDKAPNGVDYRVEYFYNEHGLESMCISGYTSPWLRVGNVNRSGTVYTARSETVRHIYYCDYSRGGKMTLLKGPTTATNPSSGVMLLPRLALNYYLLAALFLTALFGGLWLAFRKKTPGPTLGHVALAFGCYVLAHLAIKGLGGATHFLLQDLTFILLTTAALFGACRAALVLYRLHKR